MLTNTNSHQAPGTQLKHVNMIGKLEMTVSIFHNKIKSKPKRPQTMGATL